MDQRNIKAAENPEFLIRYFVGTEEKQERVNSVVGKILESFPPR